MKLISRIGLRLSAHVYVLLLCASCTKQSEKYCAMHPEDTERCGGSGDDSGTGCLDNDECAALDPAKPVCGDDRVCVECTPQDDALCTQGRVCGSDRMCGDCTAHAECDSTVCQASGRCADETSVAYVSPSGTGTECTRTAPCNNMAAAEDTARPIIKISGTVTNPDEVGFTARSTTIYADPGASVTRASSGNIIEVSNNTTELTIYGLRIFGASGNGAGNAIAVPTQSNPKLTLDRVLIEGNSGSAVRATDGGDVTITRSILANNTGSQGVYLANGRFSISNTIIAQNGSLAVVTGGAYLQPSGPSTFEFNTVADSISSSGRGITCSNGAGVDVDVTNSIIVGNDASNCNVTYSLFSPGDFIDDTGNLMGAPMFRSTSPTSSPTYYRLAATSPAKDKADTAATLATDIDGDTRPIDGRSDMGADEVAP